MVRRAVVEQIMGGEGAEIKTQMVPGIAGNQIQIGLKGTVTQVGAVGFAVHVVALAVPAEEIQDAAEMGVVYQGAERAVLGQERPGRAALVGTVRGIRRIRTRGPQRPKQCPEQRRKAKQPQGAETARNQALLLFRHRLAFPGGGPRPRCDG